MFVIIRNWGNEITSWPKRWSFLGTNFRILSSYPGDYVLVEFSSPSKLIVKMAIQRSHHRDICLPIIHYRYVMPILCYSLDPILHEEDLKSFCYFWDNVVLADWFWLSSISFSFPFVNEIVIIKFEALFVFGKKYTGECITTKLVDWCTIFDVNVEWEETLDREGEFCITANFSWF